VYVAPRRVRVFPARDAADSLTASGL
jgi:hypothetical protein